MVMNYIINIYTESLNMCTKSLNIYSSQSLCQSTCSEPCGQYDLWDFFFF